MSSDKLKDINVKLLDNKIILKHKEDKVKHYFEKLNKSTKLDKEAETEFNIKYKRITGSKLSRKKIKKTSKSKKLEK
jgi:hypothetical protein